MDLLFNIFYLALFITYIECYGQNYYFQNDKYCDDLSPYVGDINLDQISGIWYGVEKIPHTRGEYRIEHTNECFYIDIREVNIQVCKLYIICYLLWVIFTKHYFKTFINCVI